MRVVVRIIHSIERFGMRPGEGKQPFRLHSLDHRLPFDVFVARIGYVATRYLALDERAVEFDPKPFPKFAIVRERTPHARDRSLQINLLFDAIVPEGNEKGNQMVAR